MIHRSRAVIALLAVTAAVQAAGAVSAGAEDELPDVFIARAEAAGLASEINFPPLLDGNVVYSLSEATNGTAEGAHAGYFPGFLVDFVLSENKAPSIPGTAKTRHPQGPAKSSSATPFAAATGTSGPTGSNGSSRVAGQTLPFGTVGLGEATSSAGATAEDVRSEATVALTNVNIGDGAFFARQVRSTALAVAGKASGSGKATGLVDLSGVTINGTPIVFTPKGAQIGDTGGEFPATESADQVLAEAGITVRRLPNRSEIRPDGSESLFEVGGIEVTWTRAESKIVHVLGRVRVNAKGLWE